MSVAAVNITIEQGEDFSSTFNLIKPDESIASISNYTAVGTLKKHPGASTSYEFNVALNTGTAVATISLSRTVTATLSPGRYYYDLFLIAPDGTRTKAVEGNALVNGSATLPS